TTTNVVAWGSPSCAVKASRASPTVAPTDCFSPATARNRGVRAWGFSGKMVIVFMEPFSWLLLYLNGQAGERSQNGPIPGRCVLWKGGRRGLASCFGLQIVRGPISCSSGQRTTCRELRTNLMKIGLLVGREWSFPPAFLEEVQRQSAGVSAEFVKLGGTRL